MKVVGKFIEGYQARPVAVGGYVALDAQWLSVRTYTEEAVELDNRCYITLGASYMITDIRKANGDYLEPDVANQLAKEIATKDVVDLDKYDMGFFGFFDIVLANKENDEYFEEEY